MIDNFASTASKYRFLFELTDSSRVLLVGPHSTSTIEHFRHEFPFFTHIQRFEDIARPGLIGRGYELVWLEAAQDADQSCRDFMRLLGQTVLTETGSLVVTVANALSSYWIKRLFRSRSNTGRFSVLTHHYYRARLRRAGLGAVQTFLVNPYSGAPGEYFRPEVDIRHARSKGRVGRFLVKLGLHRYSYPRYALIARRQGEMLSDFIKHLDDCVRPITGSEVRLSIERVIVRVRGALILSLLDKLSDKRYICRIATTKQLDAVISRNSRILRRIHHLSGLADHHGEMVPRAIFEDHYRGCGVYVETQRPGVLAWRAQAAKPGLSGTILADSLDFILGFNIASRRAVLMTPPRYDALIGADLARLSRKLEAMGVDNEDVAAIGDQLKRHFLGRVIFLVWGHGDYGEGNLLCAPESGRLVGVIDWDTFLAVELPGVDYMNLLLQKKRSAGASIATALCSLWQDLEVEGPITARMTRRYGNPFSLTENDLRVYCCVAAIRIIGRSIPYTSEFEQYLADYIRLLEMIRHLLDARPGTPSIEGISCGENKR